MARHLLFPRRWVDAFPWLDRPLMWLDYIVFRSVFALLRLPPLAFSCRLFGRAMRLLGPLNSKKRGMAVINLRIAFPDKSETEIDRLSRQTFEHLGMAAIELLKMPTIWREWQQRIEFEVAPASHAHLSSGRPSVFATAHCGAWQVTPVPIVQTYLDRPIMMVYTPESNPMLHRLILPMRQAMGVELVSSKAGVRPLLKAMQAGQSLGFAMDTQVSTGQPVPFFGVETLTPVAPARLALKGGAALIPVQGIRVRPGYFKIIVEDPICAADPDASEEEQALDMTRQVNERFAAWISEAPGQWLCLNRRWPKPSRC